MSFRTQAAEHMPTLLNAFWEEKRARNSYDDLGFILETGGWAFDWKVRTQFEQARCACNS
jgi:hypothetical protein